MAQKVIIILFTRYPVAGKTKTRLIPSLGAQGAARLQAQMTLFTLKQIEQAIVHTDHEVRIYYTDGNEEQMRQWLGQRWTYRKQIFNDLGQKMHRAFAEAFADGADKVLLLGSDCPDNRAENIKNALQLLDTSSCVLGPAHDGGYYLLGLTQLQDDIFMNIAWGTDTVLTQTLEKVRQYTLLPPLNDVDYVIDIPEKISVIIPTYNEEKYIQSAIHTVLQAFNVEIIIADGGSTDDTCALASKLGARICHCPPEQLGRARQMNYAAQRAEGEIILFLHADCFLPPAWDKAVRKTLALGVCKEKEPVLGHFTFALSENFLGKDWLTWGTNVRAKYAHLPYGDQGFFMRKTDFIALGAYADVPFMEDVLLVKRVLKYGKVVALPLPLFTSGRRWQEHGLLKVTLLNQVMLLGAAMGVDLHTLRTVYKKAALW